MYGAYLFTQEITDFDRMSVFLNDAVNREMGVYGAHFVLESLEYKLSFSESVTY